MAVTWRGHFGCCYRWCGQFVVGLLVILSVCVATPVYDKSYTLKDDASAGTTIGNILTDTGLNTRYTVEQRRKLTLRILPQTQIEQDKFALDENTGLLYTEAQLDRDSICPGLAHCFVVFDILVESSRPSIRSIVKVNITVLDVNDHSPVFPVSTIDVNVSELAQIGSQYVIPSAEDKDSPANGIINYSLSPVQYLFYVEEGTGPLGDLRLVLNGSLDREVTATYKLTLLAVDGGEPARTGSVAVNVHIVDANDNKPVFTHSTYTASVHENLPPQSLITTVSAVDPDAGLNGQVIYSLKSKTAQQWGHKFSLDAETGELKLKAALEYADGDKYVLSVVAQDKGPNAMPAYATVILTVNDVNNHAPYVIRTSHIGPNASVPEGPEVNRQVTYLTIRDQDVGSNGQFMCKLDTTEFAIEHVYGSLYQILSLIPLNRERKDMYDFIITCTDNGTPSLTSEVKFTVKITDMNDNKPIFYKDTIDTYISENSAVGTSIATVLATDADISLNGEVRYKVAKDSAGFINVHPNTGVVTTKVVFDFEKVKSIRVHVIAHDLGDPRLSSGAVIRLTILDTNDHKPIFKKPMYTLNVRENDNNGTVVGHLQATDKDTGRFGEIKYSIIVKDNDHDVTRVFSINADKGTLFCRRMLDHERRPQYTFKVRARNVAAPYLQSMVRVTVYVTDENDNSPVFRYPLPSNNSIRVRGVVRVGKPICRVVAYDKDGRNNGRVTYSILSGNNNGLFYLKRDTGELCIARDVTGIKRHNITLKIVAKDNGYPQRMNTSTLYVYIDDKVTLAPYPASHDVTHNSMVVIIVGCVAGVIIIILIIVLICIKFCCKGGRSSPPTIKYHAGQTDQYSPRHDVISPPLCDGYGGSSGYVTDNQNDDVELSLPTEFKRRIRLSLDAPPSDNSNKNNFLREQQQHPGPWQMPLEGDNNSSTEESIPDSGRGGSDEGSISRALETDILSTGKTETSCPVSKSIPKPPATTTPGAHGAGPPIRDGLTAMWAKYQNYTSPKKKTRVTFMDPCVKTNAEKDSDNNKKNLSKSDSNLNRKRKHSDAPPEDATAAYRATMPTIQECRSPFTGRTSGHDSDSDGDTTTSGSYVVDLEDFNLSMDNMNRSVMV